MHISQLQMTLNVQMLTNPHRTNAITQSSRISLEYVSFSCVLCVLGSVRFQ